MARAMWNGAISFGLVQIPVQLVTAVRSTRPRFHMLHEKDESPVRYERVCEQESKPVPWDQIVKGFEYEKGEYAVLTKDDFKRAALEKSDTIDVLSFVPRRRSMRATSRRRTTSCPARAGTAPTRCCARRIRKSGKVGVAQLILRQSAAPGGAVGQGRRLRPDAAAAGGRSGSDGLIKTPSGKGLRDNELALAARLVDGLTDSWKPEQYKDQYAANLSAIIAAKIKGKGAKLRLGAIGPGEPRGGWPI